MTDKQKKEKIFLNAMDSWFSNFVIETFRTDHLPESKLQTEFMGTLNDEENARLPLHFSPHIYSFDFNPSYKNEIFNNDIFIYDLNTGNIKEVEYILRGLKSMRVESEKIMILISNIMTWAKTPNKIKSDNPDEIIFVHPDDIQLEQQKNTKVDYEGNNNGEDQNEENKENNENNEEKNNLEEKKEPNENNEKKENENVQENKEMQPQVKEQSVNNSVLKDNKTVNESKISMKQNQSLMKQKKEEKEEEINPIYVYYTDKDYLKRKPSSKYLDFKYIENEALSLNQKINVKSYVICPGVIYGYGEKTFYSIFRSALLGFPIEEILLDKNRNIIPTIHMRDLISIISKVIEKKPQSHYILAFDQTNNKSMKYLIKSIYHCVGDEKNILPKEEEKKVENVTKEENEENEKNEEKEEKEEKDENNEENENSQENEEKKDGEESEEKNSESKKIHPFFLNKKYMLSEIFPKELLYLDLKLLPSEFIKGQPKERYYSQLSAQNEMEQPIEYEPLFKWHCPNGIVSNMQSIRKEFTKYRNLNGNKIFVLGNPYTGKTTISRILSKIFHLPIIDSKSIVNFGKKLSGIETDEEKEKKENENVSNNNPNNANANTSNQNENNNEENENNANNNENEKINEKNNENEFNRKNSIEKDLIRDIIKTLKELEDGRAEAEEAYNKRPNKKKTDPPFDDNMYYRFNDEMMVRILKRRLQENDTSIYGFIIDGFPKNYSQAKELFEEGEKNIANPNSILIFDNMEDDYLINRLKNSEEFPKDPKDPQVNLILERANRRLNKIKEEKTEENYKSLHDFFEEEENKKFFDNKIKKIDGKNTILDIIKDVQEFIKLNNNSKINQVDEELDCPDYEYDYVKIEEEKNKPPEEPPAEENNEEKKEEVQANTNENKEENKKNNDITKKEETLLEENEEIKKSINTKEGEEISEPKDKKIEENIQKPKTQLEIEKENEFKLLEKKSEVLRRYLAENVLPLLSLGILHVANERPEDPVEALADYLLAKTFESEKKGGPSLEEDLKEENINEENVEKKEEKNNEKEVGNNDANNANIKEDKKEEDKKEGKKEEEDKKEEDKKDGDKKDDLSLDFNLNDQKEEVKLNFDTPLTTEKNKENLHPKESNESIENELNKAMIDLDE